ncbi:MAG: hypothetical protein ABL931_23295, partial [Usitatibacteraceae bacterium]
VLAKIARSLRPDGALLVSMRDGDGESIGRYHTVYWRRDDFVGRIEAAGFALVWEGRNLDTDSDAWHTFLALKREP